MSTNGIHACQKGSSNVLKSLHNMILRIVLSMSAQYFFIFLILKSPLNRYSNALASVTLLLTG